MPRRSKIFHISTLFALCLLAFIGFIVPILSPKVPLQNQTADVLASLSQGLVKQYSSLAFNGASGSTDAGGDTIGTGAFTVSAWIDPNSAGQRSTGRILDNGKTTLKVGFSNRVDFSSDGATYVSSANGSFPYGSRTFVVVTRDASGIVNIYMNGNLSGNVNLNAGTPQAGTGDIIIGNNSTGNSTFDGTMDDFRLYNRVLTTQEISSLYSAPPATSAPASTPTPPPASSPSSSSNTSSSNTTSNASSDTSSSNSSSNTSQSTNQSSSAPVAVNGVYTVKKDGSGNFTTIQACADVVQSGQTCLVSAGSYDERVIIKSSGVPSNPIIFKSNESARLKGFSMTNENYIQIQGFELTDVGFTPDQYQTPSIYINASSNIQILNNTIDHTMSSCVRLQAPATLSNYVTIQGNTISHCGSQSTTAPGVGVEIYGNYDLVEGNDISHNGEDFTRLIGGSYDVLRNNIFHDNLNSDWPGSVTHIDGMQNFCNNAGDTPLRYALIEHNTLYNAPDANSHFVIFQDYGPCGEGNIIIRYNTIHDLGSDLIVNNKGVQNIHLYNNTAVNLSTAFNPKEWEIADADNGSIGMKILNNIFYNVARPGSNIYSVDASSQNGFFADGNLGYNSDCGSSCPWNNPAGGISTEAHSILNKNPLLASLTGSLSVQAGSPAIDGGVPLTTVASSDSGGNRLMVSDAGFFQAGNGVVSADWIAVGTPNNSAQINSIDYSGNVINLSSALTRKPGDPVWLYRDSTGQNTLYGNTTDVGAQEYNNGYATLPPPVQPNNLITPQNPVQPVVPTPPVTPIPPVTPVVPVVPVVLNNFTNPLKLGDTSIDVKALQIFLNTHGFYISMTGTGSPGKETNEFGSLTQKALIRFQDFYQSDVLTPYSVSRGTGYFGVATMKKVNALLGN